MKGDIMLIQGRNKTAVALGMFDGIHVGHSEVINAALKQKEMNQMIPAVFTFRKLKKLGGSVIPYGMKFALLKSKGFDVIYSSDFDSVRDLSGEDFVSQILIDKMNCGYVSCGWDFRFSKNAESDSGDLKRICEENGIKVDIIKPVEMEGGVVSSTRIREAIKDGNIALTNRLLGYDLTYELEVVEGAKIGRTLGTPTLNQLIPIDCVLPKFGVYKSVVELDSTYDAITNIGIKPTVYSDSSPVVETHIPGFNREIYGQTVRVSLREFIRQERKFDSLDDLKIQIQEDIKATKK